MRRLLLCLALCLLPFLTGCDIDVNVTIDAQARLYYANGDATLTAPVTYGPFTHRDLNDSELRRLFADLITGYNPDFLNADLLLQFQDNITGKDLGTDGYGVSYNSQKKEFVFTELPAFAF